MLRAQEFQGLKYYEFLSLKPLPLRHAVFTRQGGVSQGVYASLNLSFDVGDSLEAVRRNRYLVKQSLGIKTLLSARQIHAKRAYLCKGPLQEDLEVEGYDILLTDQSGVGLLIKQADCQAFILYDGRRHVLALGHAGWRGLVAGVLEEAVALLKRHFGSHPGDLWAAISPSLGPCCAEFRDYKRLFPRPFWSFKKEAALFDLWALSQAKLEALGLPPNRIFLPHLCNKCSPEFFSYRREGVTGRFATVAMLL